MTAQTLHFLCRLRLLLKCSMDTDTPSFEVADVVGNLIAQIIYDAIYNSHSDIDDIKRSVNASLQLNQEVLESLYYVKETDISALYMSVKELNILLREHRINLVVDFIHETACDVLDDLGVLKRINEYDYNVCKKFSYAKWHAIVKANTAHYLPMLPHHLYAMF